LLNTVPYDEKNVAYESIMKAAIEIKPEGELDKKVSNSLNEYMFDPWVGLEGLYEKMCSKSVEAAFDDLKKGRRLVLNSMRWTIGFFWFSVE
jgi:hypothetical protein